MLLCCKFGVNRLIAQGLCKDFLSVKLDPTGCQLFLCKMHDTLIIFQIYSFCSVSNNLRLANISRALTLHVKGRSQGKFFGGCLVFTSHFDKYRIRLLQEVVDLVRIQKEEAVGPSSVFSKAIYHHLHSCARSDRCFCMQGLLFHHPYLLNVRLKHVALFTPVSKHVSVAVADFRQCCKG